MEGLGVAPAGNAIMEWQQFQRWGMHNVEYGTAVRKALTIAKPLTAIGLGAAAIFGLTALIGKLRRHEKSEPPSRQT